MLRNTMDRSQDYIKKKMLEEAGEDGVEEGDKFNYDVRGWNMITKTKNYSKKKKKLVFEEREGGKKFYKVEEGVLL